MSVYTFPQSTLDNSILNITYKMSKFSLFMGATDSVRELLTLTLYGSNRLCTGATDSVRELLTLTLYGSY